MKEINLENYVEWFVDYKDGLLTEFECAALFDFIETNSYLKTDFELWQNISENLTSDKNELIPFPLKSSLLKEDTIGDDTILALIEGDLKKEEIDYVNQLVFQSKFYKKQFDDLKKCRLEKDIKIVYPHKNKLLKRGTIMHFYRYAAVILVLFWVGFVLIEFVFFKQQTFTDIPKIIINKVEKQVIDSDEVEIQKEESKEIFVQKRAKNQQNFKNIEPVLYPKKADEVEKHELLAIHSLELKFPETIPRIDIPNLITFYSNQGELVFAETKPAAAISNSKRIKNLRFVKNTFTDWLEKKYDAEVIETEDKLKIKVGFVTYSRNKN